MPIYRNKISKLKIEIKSLNILSVNLTSLLPFYSVSFTSYIQILNTFIDKSKHLLSTSFFLSFFWREWEKERGQLYLQKKGADYFSSK